MSNLAQKLPAAMGGCGWRGRAWVVCLLCVCLSGPGEAQVEPGLNVPIINFPFLNEGSSSGLSYPVTLTTQPTGTVTVTPSFENSGDSAFIRFTPTTPMIFTTTNWNQPQTLTATAIDDGELSPGNNRTIRIIFTATGADYEGITDHATVTVFDDDRDAISTSHVLLRLQEVGRTAGSYRLMLEARPESSVFVTITSEDPSVAAVMPGRVEFTTANWDTPQSVTVTGFDDGAIIAQFDRSVEIMHEVTSTDDDYDGVVVTNVRVQVEDNGLRPRVNVDTDPLFISEGSSGSYTIALGSQPVGGSATVSVESITAGEGGDASVITVMPMSLEFTPSNWNTPQSITVSVVDDDVANNPPFNFIVIRHTISGANYELVIVSSVAVNTTHFDDMAGLDVSVFGFDVDEDGDPPGRYTVALESEPIAEVTVALTSSDTADVTVAPPELTFTASNWDQSQSVTVTGVNDDLDNPGNVRSARIEHLSRSDDTNYEGLSTSIQITVVDDDDASVGDGMPGVTLSTTDLDLDEDGAVGSYTVVLATEPTGPVTVTPTSLAPGTATVSGALTFTTTNWDTAQTVTVTGVDDDVDNPSDARSVTISHVVSGYGTVTSAASVSVTVADDDTSGVTLSATSLEVGEDGASGSYTVVLTSQPTGPATVTPTSSAPGSATVSGALTFTTTNWNRAQTVTVTGVDDDVDNPSDARSVTISHAVSGYGTVTSAASVAVTVTDDDTRGLTLSATSLEVDEDGATGSYTVVLDSQPPGSVTVTPTSSVPGNATVSGALTFTTANWNRAQTVTVTGVNDDLDNPSDARSTTISHAVSGYGSVTSAASVAVTVTDDDTAGGGPPGVTVSASTLEVDEDGATGTYTVVLDSQPSGPVTVTPTSSVPGSATVSGALTFTTTNWDTAQTVTVTSVDDDLDNPSDARSTTISHAVSGYGSVTSAASVMVTVTDDDTRGVTVSATSLAVDEGGAPGSYTVRLTSQPTGTVTITPTSANRSAVTVSPASLSFTTGNWRQAQTVLVTGVDNSQASSATAAITHRVAGADYGSVPAASVTVTVADNDTPGVTLSETRLTLTEAGGTGEYTIVLNTRPTGAVTIRLAADATAVTLEPATLTFTTANWNRAQTVQVTGVDDNVANDGNTADRGSSPLVPRTVTVTHRVTGADYGSVEAGELQVVVTDDELADVPVSESELTVDENGGSDTYTVVLASQPSGQVTVTPTADSPAVTLAPATLTFTATSWNQAQTVRVTGVNDDLDNAGDSREVTISNEVTATRDDNYSLFDAADVQVTVSDDDTAGVTLSTPNLAVIEAGGAATYTVALTSQPTGSVVVTPTSSAPGNATVSGALTFTASNWNRAQTVTVTGVNDAVDNPSDARSATISHTVSGYGTVTSAASVAVTVTDDDQARVILSATNLAVSEAGGTATYTVELTSQPTGAVVVTPTSSAPGNATVSGALTFTTTNWNTAQTVTVTGVNDALVNPGGRRTATIRHAVTGYGALTTAADVGVVVGDDDTPGVTLSETRLTLAEAGGTGTYRVMLNTQPTGSVVVTPTSSAPGSATVSGALTFTTTNWNQLQTITVTGVNDDLDNPSDARSLTISHTVSGYGSVTSAASVAVTVRDDDTASLILTPALLTLREAGGRGEYTAVLASQPAGEVVVTLTSGDESVVTLAPARLTFTVANWDEPQTVTLTGVNDAVDNPNDVRRAAIAHAISGYGSVTSGPDTAVMVTDDDTAGVTLSESRLTLAEAAGRASYTVVLATQPTGAVTVTPMSASAAITLPSTALTFTTGNWNQPQSVQVTGVNDDLDNPADMRGAMVTHRVTGYGAVTGAAAVTVTVTDDDTAGVTLSHTTRTLLELGGTSTYTVALDSQPSGFVTVTLMSGDETVVTVTPSSLTFTVANWNQPRVVTLRGVNDNLIHPEGGRTTLVSHQVTGYGAVTAATVTARVTDKESPGVQVNDLARLEEAGGRGSYLVWLRTLPTDTVTVMLSSADTTIALVAPAMLTFTVVNWNRPQPVTVTAIDDDLDNPGDVRLTSVIHTVTSTDSSYATTPVPDVPITVSDDDRAGVTVSESALAVPEGGTAEFNLVLSSQPSGQVTVTPASSAPADVTVTPSSLTFTVDDWDQPRSVTVTGVNDNLANPGGGRSATISHAVTGYGQVATASDVTVTVIDDERPGVIVSRPARVLAESGGTADYTVVLTTEPTGTVTIMAGSTSAAITLAPARLIFTPSNWNRPQSVTVTGVDDDVDNPRDARTATIRHLATGADYAGLQVSAVTVTVTDDDTAGAELSEGVVSLEEDGGTADYTVVLTSAPTGRVTVTPRSSDARAATASGPLTFTPDDWDQPQTVTVTGVNDNRVNAGGERLVTIAHAIAGYGLVSRADEVEVQVSDDDMAGVTLSATSLTLTEAAGRASYTVVLTSAPEGEVRVTPMSASPAITVTPAMLTFRASNWSQLRTVRVTGVNDDLANPMGLRRATITHSVTGTGYESVAAASVAVMVTDDDEPGVTLSATSLTLAEAGGTGSYTVVLNTQPTGAVTVTPMGASAAMTLAPAALTFTAGTWRQPQTVQVTGVNDDLDNPGDAREGTVTHRVTGYGAVTGAPEVTVTVTDDDEAGVTLSATSLTLAEAGGTGSYTVVLATQPTGAVTVTPMSASAAITLAPATLMFTAGNWRQPQTVQVTGVNDDVANPGGARTAAVSHQVAGGDYGAIRVASLMVRVSDDDSPGVTISEQARQVAEAGGTASYTVVLVTQPTGAVTVTPAASGPAITLSPEQLVFTASNWRQPRSVTVTGVDDAVANPGDARTVTVTHAVTGADYAEVTASSVMVTVTNDDTAGVTLSESALTVAEAGGTARYTLVLLSEPTGPVTITPVSADLTALTLAPPRLSFTAQNWNAPQTLTVTGVNDNRDNPGDARAVAVSHTVRGADYGSVTAASVAVTISDDDTAGVTLSESALTVAEAGGTARYTVVLDTQPASTVSVVLEGSVPGAATVVPGRLVFSGTSWNQPQQVTVTGVNDDLHNAAGERLVAIRHAVTGYGAAISVQDVMVTVLDDDVPGVTVSETTRTLSEAGGQASYTLVLNTRPETDSVTITLSSSASAIATITSTRLVFSGTSWNQPQRVTVTGVNDNLDNPGDARTATITHAVTGYGTVTSAAPVMVTVLDDDVPGVTISETARTVPEAAGTAMWTVVLDTEPLGDVVLTPVSSATTSATVSGPLTFMADNWDEPQTVTITGVNDDRDNLGDMRRVTVTHAVTGTGYGAVTAASVAVTVLDDDGVTVGETRLDVAEAGGEGTYTMQLESQPTRPVTVTLTLTGPEPAALTASPMSLTFMPDNWAVAQRVTVTGVDDDQPNPRGERIVTIEHLVEGYREATQAASVTVTVLDDEIRVEDIIAPALIRFGRALGEQTLEAVATRVRLQQGVVRQTRGTSIQLAGRTLSPCRAPAGRGQVALSRGQGSGVHTGQVPGLGGSCGPAGSTTSGPPSRFSPSWAETAVSVGPYDAPGVAAAGPVSGPALADSGFSTVLERPTGATLSLWGQVAHTKFQGPEVQQVTMAGEVTSFMLGGERAGGSGLLGLAVSHNLSKVDYELAEQAGSGEIEVELAAVTPYAGVQLAERLQAWAAAGAGWGDMTWMPEGLDAHSEPVQWYMGAAGFEGALVRPAPQGGMGLDIKADVLFTQTQISSDTFEDTGSSSEDSDSIRQTQRARLSLEGRGERKLLDGGRSVVHAGVGMRYDAGDAETGLGLEVGGGVELRLPAQGLELVLSGRVLALHDEEDFRSWGVSPSLSWARNPRTQQGWSVQFKHEFGTDAAGSAVDALPGPSGFTRLAETGSGRQRWSLEVAHGSQFGWGGLGRPYTRLGGASQVEQARLGYRLEAESLRGLRLSVDLWSGLGLDRQPEVSGGLQLRLRW